MGAGSSAAASGAADLRDMSHLKKVMVAVDKRRWTVSVMDGIMKIPSGLEEFERAQSGTSVAGQCLRG